MPAEVGACVVVLVGALVGAPPVLDDAMAHCAAVWPGWFRHAIN